MRLVYENGLIDCEYLIQNQGSVNLVVNETSKGFELQIRVKDKTTWCDAEYETLYVSNSKDTIDSVKNGIIDALSNEVNILRVDNLVK